MQSSAAWEEKREQKIYISTVRRVTNTGAGGDPVGPEKNNWEEKKLSPVHLPLVRLRAESEQCRFVPLWGRVEELEINDLLIIPNTPRH